MFQRFCVKRVVAVHPYVGYLSSMAGRMVYTHHPQNFVFYRHPRPVYPQVGQESPLATIEQFRSPPVQSAPPWLPSPGQGTVTSEDGKTVTVVWPYLLLAGVLSGAAFAVGSNLVTRYIFGKK